MHFNIIASYFLFWVICYTLREIPHIWSKSTTYKLRWKWMAESRWWTDASPRENRTWYNVVFADAYHFFGNLPRITGIVLLLIFVGWSYAWLLLVWFVGRLGAEYILLKK